MAEPEINTPNRELNESSNTETVAQITEDDGNLQPLLSTIPNPDIERPARGIFPIEVLSQVSLAPIIHDLIHMSGNEILFLQLIKPEWFNGEKGTVCVEDFLDTLELSFECLESQTLDPAMKRKI